MTLPRATVAETARTGAHRAGLQAVLAACALLAFCGFVALGIWQVERRAWKHALVERVESRVHAAAQDAPGPARWPQVNAAEDEYRHVRLTGRLLHDRTTRVQATTALGAGFWAITPLLRPDGSTVLVNRGFVPAGWQPPSADAAGMSTAPTTLTGLLRMTEPGGGFLRRNDPAADRWHSRDVQAIAAARGLSRVAPYFVDAAAPSAPSPAAADGERTWPAAGLTVVSFPDNHLVYALTWWALAAMVAAASAYVVRDARRRPGPATGHTPGTPADTADAASRA